MAIVRLLVDKGAAVNAVDRWGGTPLRDAVRESRSEAASILLKAGGEIGYNEVEASGELCENAKQGSLEHLKVLLASGCMVNSADCSSRKTLTLFAQPLKDQRSSPCGGR